MATALLVFSIFIQCLTAVSGQFNSARSLDCREGFKASGVQLIEREFKSPSLINCNLRCFKSTNCVATNFQLLTDASGGECELLLPHELEDDAVVLSKQINSVYTRIKSGIKFEKKEKENAESQKVSPPLDTESSDAESMDELERVANEVSASIAETLETRSRSSPISYQTSIMPSYPILIKPTGSSVSPIVVTATDSISLCLPEPEGAESKNLCSKEGQSKNASSELNCTESVSSLESSEENSCLIRTTVRSINSTASEHDFSASTAVVSAAVLIPPNGFYTSSLSLSEESSHTFAIAGSMVTTPTMSVSIHEGTYTMPIPSASLQPTYELSTLTYKCLGFSIFSTCYAFIQASVSWSVAKNACINSNGYLVKISSSTKLNYLKNWYQDLSNAPSSFHVGIHQNKGSSAKWVDGQTLYGSAASLYTVSGACSESECCGNLSFNNNNAVYMLTDTCDNNLSYICQRKK